MLIGDNCGDVIKVIDTFASLMTIAGVLLAIYIAVRWKTRKTIVLSEIKYLTWNWQLANSTIKKFITYSHLGISLEEEWCIY